MSITAKPPFKYFTDAAGEALEAGKIYVGVAGLDAESNPITAYWDSAATVAAVQPIRTIGGAPDNSGTPSDFFTSGDYSITVRDKNDVLVYSKLQLNANDPDNLGLFKTYDTVPDFETSTEAARPVGSIVWYGPHRGEVVSSGGNIQNSAGTPMQLKVLVGGDGTYNLEAFGLTLDGVADDSSGFIAAVDAIKQPGILTAPPVLIVPEGKTLRIATVAAIDGGSVEVRGYGASLDLAVNNAIDIGDASYLTNISIGLYTFILSGFDTVVGAGFLGIRNRGYRKLLLNNVKSLAGLTFLETEGCYAGGGMFGCRIQSTTGDTVHIKQRNNLWTFGNNAITGAGGNGVKISCVDAEMKGVSFVGRNDIEGSAGGVSVSGTSSKGAFDFRGLWFENNTLYNIQIDNAVGQSNTDGISITQCEITGAGVDILIGTSAAGGAAQINGVFVDQNDFSNSDLIVMGNNKVLNMQVGNSNRLAGTSVITLPTQTAMIANQVDLPVHNAMPMHTTPPAVPFASSDTKGVLGEIRWETGEAWIKTSEGWMNWQVGTQADGTIDFLATGASPDIKADHKLRTNNSGATSVTSFVNGRAGQELIITGLDGGNTTIVDGGNIFLAGSVNFTLTDRAVLHLINQDGTNWVEISRSTN